MQFYRLETANPKQFSVFVRWVVFMQIVIDIFHIIEDRCRLHHPGFQVIFFPETKNLCLTNEKNSKSVKLIFCKISTVHKFLRLKSAVSVEAVVSELSFVFEALSYLY